MEVCLTCDKYFPMHQLHLHVESGECESKLIHIMYTCLHALLNHLQYSHIMFLLSSRDVAGGKPPPLMQAKREKTSM